MKKKTKKRNHVCSDYENSDDYSEYGDIFMAGIDKKRFGMI